MNNLNIIFYTLIMSKNIEEIISQLDLTKEQQKPIVDIVKLFYRENKEEKISEEYSLDFLWNLQQLFKGNQPVRKKIRKNLTCDFDRIVYKLSQFSTHTGLDYANQDNFRKNGNIFLTFKEDYPEVRRLLQNVPRAYNKGGVVQLKVDRNSCLNCEKIVL